jgi:DNA-binding transcriptional LysR family regulator
MSMDSLHLLYTFREVAALASFSRAAARLRISRPTVTKHVAELEKRFDVRLLNRSTRAVSLTNAGQILLDCSEPLVEMAELTNAELRGHARHPQGRLRVAVPYGLDRTGFPHVLGQFMQAYPDVHVELHVTNRVIDLVQEGCDLALRVGRLRDENLIVRRLARVNWVLCATPQYWARKGMPVRPDELLAHAILGFAGPGGTTDLPFCANDEGYSLPVQTRMEADDPALLLSMALEGLGVASLPWALARPHLERGALVPVLGEFMPRDIWFHAAYVQRRHNSAALRTLLNFLESHPGRLPEAGV